ncbi:MAG: hypothetical protein ACLP50_14420 [Solirubrobacteraceae bacterium]
MTRWTVSWEASNSLAMIVGNMPTPTYSMQTPIFSTDVGLGYLSPAVTAVFLGASQFQQRPNVSGTLIAYFALAFGIQGLALSSSNGSVWSRPLFEGAALIVAVAFASRTVIAKRRARATPPPGAPAQTVAAPAGSPES